MSYSKGDSRSLIQLRDSTDERYLRTYNSVAESVEHYYLLISKVSSYEKFREKRWKGESSSQLIRYMESYHESSGLYTEMAQSIIASNNLVRYDNVSIDPGHKEILTLKKFLMKY